ncbi:hypothetical protein Misp02_21250 [Microtetraspora sp. NBRC 16547]|nr:hypothetical protein Misp02_21250 [Microtetraspora sp. NBRC 16547]
MCSRASVREAAMRISAMALKTSMDASASVPSRAGRAWAAKASRSRRWASSNSRSYETSPNDSGNTIRKRDYRELLWGRSRGPEWRADTGGCALGVAEVT